MASIFCHTVGMKGAHIAGQQLVVDTGDIVTCQKQRCRGVGFRYKNVNCWWQARAVVTLFILTVCQQIGQVYQINKSSGISKISNFQVVFIKHENREWEIACHVFACFH